MQLATTSGALNPALVRASHWVTICVVSLLARELDLSDFVVGRPREYVASLRRGPSAFVARAVASLEDVYLRVLHLLEHLKKFVCILVGWDFFRWAMSAGARVVRSCETERERRGTMLGRPFYVVQNERGEWDEARAVPGRRESVSMQEHGIGGPGSGGDPRRPLRVGAFRLLAGVDRHRKVPAGDPAVTR